MEDTWEKPTGLNPIEDPSELTRPERRNNDSLQRTVPPIQPTTRETTVEQDATGTHNEVGGSRGQEEAKSAPEPSEPRSPEPAAPRRST